MAKRVVIFPTESEGEFFKLDLYEKVICGVGQAECAATVARICADERPETIILAGIAGSYTDRYKTGTTVVVGSESVADLGAYRDGRFVPLYEKRYLAPDADIDMPVVSSNTVNCSSTNLIKHTADIENMEGAAFFAVCAALHVPCIEIRTVSNIVGSHFDQGVVRQCSRRLAEELKRILKNLK